MTRVLGRLMSPEMAVLGLCELALSFLFIYALLTVNGVLPSLPGGSYAGADSGHCANLAAVLALTIALAAAVIGLYRPEIFIERRRLLVNAGAAGILAFPAVLLVDAIHKYALRANLS